jgi:hypothetical protein
MSMNAISVLSISPGDCEQQLPRELVQFLRRLWTLHHRERERHKAKKKGKKERKKKREKRGTLNPLTED